MADDIAIKVENVSKDFSYARRKAVTVKSAFTGVLKRKAKDEKTVQHALKDISFEIKKGEFFGIVGRNGSGKSTLLKMLAGIYQPTKGNITVNGKLVPFIELGVGFNPELTGRENVYMNGALLGFSEKEVSRFYDEVVEFAELEHYMDKKLKNYSSGMQVRLAFSMAIRAKADILLIDEVLAVGDADFQRKCFNYFKQLKKNKTTVVFVSHDMNAVREYCDRAILITNTDKIIEGDPNSIASEYSKLFIEHYNPHLGEPKKGDRWGDRNIQITSIDVPLKLTPDKHSFKVKISVKSNSDITSPVIGFVIKNMEGQNILGTNSQIEEKRIRDLKTGEELTIEWTVPNILSDGKYSFTAAVVYDNGSSIADWWDEAVQMISLHKSLTPYLTKPNVKTRIVYETQGKDISK